MLRVIISGGGTGGHIFPAISIANALCEAVSDIEILFVGATGRMEMEKVPAAGYEIVGLPVAGFQRRFTLQNLLFPFRLAASMYKASSVLRCFRPDVVVGVGGYASGPMLRCAARHGIPCLIQEQNSYPGVTNKILAKDVKTICVAYPGMERFFPAEKIIFTGNPVRQDLQKPVDRAEAAAFFGLDASRPVVLVIGGSLGARSINNGIADSLSDLGPDTQLLWQTGKFYYDTVRQKPGVEGNPNVRVHAFIKRMDYAYALADVVISRAGAGSISELSLLGKACILVPSPNVAEDHQTKNAKALVAQGAAMMVADDFAKTLLAETQLLLADRERLRKYSEGIKVFARPYAAVDIAREVMTIARTPAYDNE